MERVGFERGLDEMLQSEMVVKEIVTDGHVEIGALISIIFKIYTNVISDSVPHAR